MSKYLGPRLKFCRKNYIDLNLKSNTKSIEKKCKFKKNININYKNKTTEYCLQLKEKQKLKKLYCIFENQFFKYYKKSLKFKYNINEKLFQFLEMRLDNIIFRVGISKTRFESRQIINHKFIIVNNNICNIPSYNLKINDNIKVSNKFKKKMIFINFINNKNKKNIDWLEISKDKEDFNIKIIKIPSINDINDKNINVNLIIESYSK